MGLCWGVDLSVCERVCCGELCMPSQTGIHTLACIHRTVEGEYDYVHLDHESYFWEAKNQLLIWIGNKCTKNVESLRWKGPLKKYQNMRIVWKSVLEKTNKGSRWNCKRESKPVHAQYVGKQNLNFNEPLSHDCSGNVRLWFNNCLPFFDLFSVCLRQPTEGFNYEGLL